MPDEEVTTPSGDDTTTTIPQDVVYVDLFGQNPKEDPNATIIMPKIFKEALIDKHTGDPVFSEEEADMNFVTTSPSDIIEFLPPTPNIATGVGDANDPDKKYVVDNNVTGEEGNDGIWTASKIVEFIQNAVPKLIDSNGNEYQWAFDADDALGVKLIK